MTEVVDRSRATAVTRITASRTGLELRELWRERELLYFLASRSVKVRYKQALAGPLWAVFQPLLTMAIFSVVFGRLAHLPSDGLPGPVFYFTGLVLWTFIANSLTSATVSVAENQHMVSKIYFPRVFLPLSACLASLGDLVVATLTCLPLLLAFDVVPSGRALLLVLPVLVALSAVAGLGMLLSALNARYRDVRFAVPFLVTAGLFASPVSYSSSLVPEGWRPVYALNPAAGAIDGFRWALTGAGNSPWLSLGVSAASAVFLLTIGLLYFQRVEGTIADVV